MTSLQSINQLPTLPPELWIAITGYVCQLTTSHDLAYLWTGYRNISKLFQQQVDRVFIAKHLPKTRIQFNLGKNHVMIVAPVPMAN